MSSALSITQSVNPPRAVFLDFPLGHTAGKPNDPQGQLAIMQHTLKAFASLSSPGEIKHLPFTWHPDDAWKDNVMRPQRRADKADRQHADDRVARHASPQYQTAADEAMADPRCPTCVFPEQFEDR